jgi:polyphosphate kinase
VPQNREPVLVASRDESVTTYVSLADVIGSNLDLVLPGKRILASSLFRVTRSAEVKLEEEVAEDLVEMIYDVLEKRRTAHPVRLEVSPDMPDDMLSLLSEQLDVDEYEVYRHAEPMTLRNLEFLTHLDRPDLKYPAWSPEPHRRLEHDESSIFDEIKRGDILLHHPYHSFELTTQRFFNEIARDPDVLAIKVALYRTANDSKVIQALMDAGDRGKQVAAIVELKARFDERRNVAWVQRLEEKGIHVAYGMIDMKTHTKIALAVRREEDGLRFYSHVGTGNYHSQTAKTYVDLGLLTADESIGRDLMHVFNMFTGPLHEAEYNTLLVAPFTMKDRFRELIRRERELAGAGKPARIVAKVNAVEDVEMCRELYEAARTGVDIDLICRDICRIRPGLDGITDSLRVHSVVGRFLEHSRIFYFHNDGDPLWYLGSADWMTRNLDRRMEAVTPVRDPRLQRELRNVLEAMLSDNRRRWAMQSDGSYRQLEPNDGTFEFDAQHYLMERARWAARGVEHPLPEHAASIASGDQ